MIALLFEVLPKPGHEGRYFELAASLRPEAENSGGLAFIDRFRSQMRPGWILSHQLWRDAESVARWRAHAAHRAAQAAGCTQHFADYRIRIGEVIAEAEAGEASDTVPSDASPEACTAGPRLFAIVASQMAPFAVSSAETFASVYREGEFVAVAEIASVPAGKALLREAMTAPHVMSARLCRVVRDYGMHERAEAP
jgi:heme-degrading monooxygenase HmoA